MAFTQVTLTVSAGYRSPAGDVLPVRIYATPRVEMVNGTRVPGGVPILIPVNAGGTATRTIAATDDPGTSPSGNVYQFQIVAGGYTVRSFLAAVPHASPTVDIDALTPLSAPPSVVTADSIYTALKTDLTPGANVTITPNDSTQKITVAAATSGASGIPASTVDAKGDLIAGTANDTVARLGVGTDGQALVANSANATGLGWAAPAPASHTHAATDLASGTVPTARLGSGTANATTFLRGDQTWQTAVAYTDEQAQDAAGAMLTAGVNTGITATYNDAANRVDLAVQPGTGSAVPWPQDPRCFTFGATSPTAPTVPGAPTITGVTAGSAQVTVAFTPPASNGGASISSYTVTSFPGSKTATGAASPIVVTGLTNGTSYTFSVHATNSVGDSAESAASSPVTPTAAAAPPPTAGTSTPATWWIPFGQAPICRVTYQTGNQGSTVGLGSLAVYWVASMPDARARTNRFESSAAVGVQAQNAFQAYIVDLSNGTTVADSGVVLGTAASWTADQFTPVAGRRYQGFARVRAADGQWSPYHSTRFVAPTGVTKYFESYGMVGDGFATDGTDYGPYSQVVTDGATTSGSPTVTSASAHFTADDVGKQITGSGIPGGATISAVGSTTSITISANATATATGVTLTRRLAASQFSGRLRTAIAACNPGDVLTSNAPGTIVTASSSGTTLTAGSSVFTAGMVGKKIMIYGGGSRTTATDAFVHRTTVAAYTSGTQITLTTAPTTAVTNAKCVIGYPEFYVGHIDMDAGANSQGGVTIDGTGCLFTSLDPDHAGFRTSGVTDMTYKNIHYWVKNVTIRGNGQNNNDCPFYVESASTTGGRILGCYAEHPKDAGFLFNGSATDWHVVDCVADHTMADPFHVTGNVSDIQFIRPTGYYVGDDASANIGYRNAGDASRPQRVTWEAPTTYGQDWGRGVSLGGSKDTLLTDVTIDKGAGAIFFIGSDGDQANTTNVQIRRATITNPKTRAGLHPTYTQGVGTSATVNDDATIKLINNGSAVRQSSILLEDITISDPGFAVQVVIYTGGAFQDGTVTLRGITLNGTVNTGTGWLDQSTYNSHIDFTHFSLPATSTAAAAPTAANS